MCNGSSEFIIFRAKTVVSASKMFSKMRNRIKNKGPMKINLKMNIKTEDDPGLESASGKHIFQKRRPKSPKTLQQYRKSHKYYINLQNLRSICSVVKE